MTPERGNPLCFAGRFSRATARLAALLLVAGVVAQATPAAAQSVNLRNLMTNLLRRGITLANPVVPGFTDHSAHFIGADSPQFSAVDQVNFEIASQLSSFPLTSSAGGFVYTFDETGLPSRATESFGPIYMERSPTIGKGKFNLGINYSQFSFDHIDDLSLRDGDMRLVFTHDDVNHDGSNLHSFVEGDVITADVSVSITTNITALVATFGASDRLDLGLAIPVVEVDMTAVSEAAIERLATGEALTDSTDFRFVHQFTDGSQVATFESAGRAEGLGDVLVTAKYRFGNAGDALGVALGANFRLPTGDERDLLGTGEFQGGATLIASLQTPTMSPSLNVGYTLSGGDFPNELSYDAGVDWVVDPRMTLAVGLLGRFAGDVTRVRVENEEFRFNPNPDPDAPLPDPLPSAEFPVLAFDEGRSRNAIDATVGVKLNFYGNLLLSLNGLIPLTDDGLRDDFTPLLGIDYSF